MNFQSKDLAKSVFDFLIQLSIVVLIIVASFNLLNPFFSLITWSLIITISLTPLHQKVTKWLGGRKKIAAALITVFFLAIILGPFGFVIGALIKNLSEVKDSLTPEAVAQMQLDDSIKSLPLVGDEIDGLWNELTQDEEAFIENHKDKIMAVGEFVLTSIASAGKSVLLFFGAMIISGFLLAFTEQRQDLGVRMGIRVAGETGKKIAIQIEKTIRSVVSGVLGVAVVQATLAGIGFFVMGIPFAGIWTIGALFLAMIQVGVGPISLVLIIYAFGNYDTTPAVIFLIYNLLVMISDNILKPILMGRGLDIPMLIVFMGAIGGMVADGILGLFLGPVILSVAYNLFMSWLDPDKAKETENPEEAVNPAG